MSASTFWQNLSNKAHTNGYAFTALAPMEDVTDVVFRQIVLEEGRPDVFFTEFTNCDGLNSRGRPRVIHRLRYNPEQLPVIAQVWGRRPETYIATVPMLIEMGFTGVDINMACPVPKVIKTGAGGGLIRDSVLALEIIAAMKEAILATKVKEFAFSVKTRIGFKTIQFDWVEKLLSQQLDAVTFHLRTVSELTKVPAHWELAQQISTLKQQLSPNTALILNGDITNKEQLKTYGKQYGADGLMVGRGIFQNLWIFSDKVDESAVTPVHRLSTMKRHLTLFLETWGDTKNFELLKKFFKVYLKNFEGANELRDTLQWLKSPAEMLQIIDAQIQLRK